VDPKITLHLKLSEYNSQEKYLVYFFKPPKGNKKKQISFKNKLLSYYKPILKREFYSIDVK